MRQLVSETTAHRWTDLLIESDRSYFAAGATLHPVPGGHLAAMPALASFSAGAVVLLDAPGAILSGPHAWREATVAVCAKRGAALLRFYTVATEPKLMRALKSAGLASAQELAMAASAIRILATGDDDAAGWSLREVTTRALWRTKRRLHELTPERPDGKPVDAESWVRLERAKVRAGYMSAWLIERDGEACGAFGLSFTPQMVRFKNLFVAPEHRARGAASAALRLIAREVLARGFRTIGCFALAGGRSERLYVKAGFTKVGSQVEWTTPAVAAAHVPKHFHKMDTRNAFAR
jgi:GNAT superfamily N-acetyltransferase